MEELLEFVEVLEEEQVTEPVYEVVQQVVDTSNIESMLQQVISHQTLTNTILLWTLGVLSALLVILLMYKFIKVFY